MRSATSIRVVPDACLLIDLWRSPAVAREVEQRRLIFRMSAVVHSELLRGVRGRTEQRLIDGLVRDWPAVAPSPGDWARAGTLLGRLRNEHGFETRGLRFIQNDILIALTARQVGAAVLTTNGADFRLIAGYIAGLKVIELFGPADTGDAK